MAVTRKKSSRVTNVKKVKIADLATMEKDLKSLRKTIARAYTQSIRMATKEISPLKRSITTLTNQKSRLSQRLKKAKARLSKKPTAVVKKEVSKITKEHSKVVNILKNEKPKLAAAVAKERELKAAARRFTALEKVISKTETALDKPKKRARRKTRAKMAANG